MLVAATRFRTPRPSLPSVHLLGEESLLDVDLLTDGTPTCKQRECPRTGGRAGRQGGQSTQWDLISPGRGRRLSRAAAWRHRGDTMVSDLSGAEAACCLSLFM